MKWEASCVQFVTTRFEVLCVNAVNIISATWYHLRHISQASNYFLQKVGYIVNTYKLLNENICKRNCNRIEPSSIIVTVVNYANCELQEWLLQLVIKEHIHLTLLFS